MFKGKSQNAVEMTFKRKDHVLINLKTSAELAELCHLRRRPKGPHMGL